MEADVELATQVCCSKSAAPTEKKHEIAERQRDHAPMPSFPNTKEERQ